MTTHLCHALGCNRAVPPKMLFCRPHGDATPQHIKDAVWETFRKGQEV